MRIIAPRDTSLMSMVRTVDEKIILQLVDSCLKIKKDDENATIYSKFYESKFRAFDMTSSSEKLLNYLQLVKTTNGGIRTKEQGKEYRWIIVNEASIGETAYRFYFAPKPENMHAIVQKLTEEFTKNNIPVKFKYQLSGKMAECDRIIVYSDFLHRESIEKAISKVYKENSQLVVNSERALPWIYESTIPNVYLAPETPNSSYGEKFAETMINAKEIFCYMYGVTDSNNKLNLSGDDAKRALDCLKLIVVSLLFRNGLLLSKDGRQMEFKDNIKTIYDYKSGRLKNFCDNQDGYHSATFLQNSAGKNAFINNFYGVSMLSSEDGIIVEHLTPDERRRQLNEALYKDYYVYKNNQQQDGPKK